MSERLTTLGAFAQIGRIYLSWAPTLLLLALIVFLPVGLVNALAISIEIGSFDLDNAVRLLGATSVLLLLAATGLLGEVFYTGIVAASLTNVRDSRPASLRDIAASIHYGRLIAVDFIYGVLVAMGLILLLAPGVAAFGWLALAAPIVEIEDRGVRAAFARSARLVRGRFWTVLAVLVPIEIVGEGIAALAAELAGELAGDSLLSDWLTELMTNLAFTPFYAVAAVLLTVALIWEKEGGGPRLHSSPVSA